MRSLPVPDIGRLGRHRVAFFACDLSFLGGAVAATRILEAVPRATAMRLQLFAITAAGGNGRRRS